MASTRTKTKTRLKLPSEGELVLVSWMDACVHLGWEDHREAKAKTAHCKSIGWVGCSPDPDTMLILYADKAHEDQEDHDSNRRLAVPVGWITSIKRIKE